MIRQAFALVGRITERVFPDRLMLGDRVASWPDALAQAEERVDVYEPQEVPTSPASPDWRAWLGTLLQTSPAGASDSPTPASAGRSIGDLGAEDLTNAALIIYSYALLPQLTPWHSEACIQLADRLRSAAYPTP